MYQQPQQGMINGGWNAPGAGASAVSWNGGGSAGQQASVVSQYDSSSFYNQQQQQHNYQQQQYPNQQASNTGLNSNNNTNNVTLYTQYYHDWKKFADSPTSSQQEKEWATYYSDLASRAAHYYHQNPYSTPPPPQQLPPPPPSQQPQQQQQQQQQQHQNYHQQSQNACSLGEKSFQAYVDRCLQQCQTPKEKELMLQSTKTVLQKALREGYLHNKDWSQEPLLAPPPRSQAPANSQAGYYGPAGGGAGHYGPASSLPQKLDKNSSKKKDKPSSVKKRSYLDSPPASTDNSSYYGPSASSSLSSPSLSFINTGSSKRSKKTNHEKGTKGGFNMSAGAMNRRAERFASSFQQSASSDADSVGDDASGTLRGPVIIGTCQVLEKEYLRLTSAPKPELVRPQSVLERHFGNLKKEYAEPKLRHDYLWFCSQLKAIRQDCTVQHLKNAFVVQVYEFHAKIALEQEDLNEFNQCQTQLKYLYPALRGMADLPNRSEFLSYRILYSVNLTLHNEKATIDMKDIFGSEESSNDPSVKHAMTVLSAARGGNYVQFFRCFPSEFGHQNYFLEKMAPYFRVQALKSMCAAYRPHIDADFVCRTLKISGRAELEQMGCVLETIPAESDGEEERVVIKTKESDIKEPEPADKSKLM